MAYNDNYLNNNSVDQVLNDAYKIATGQSDVENLTLKDIIDAGTTDGGALVGKKEQFTKALIMMWAKNLFMDTEFTGEDDDPYYVDSREYGAVVQMIGAQAPDVQESHAWKEFTSGVSQVGVYTVYLPIVTTKYYGKTSSWELPIAISYEQYSDAFKDAEGFNAFRAYIFTVLRNKIKEHRKTMNDANRNNFMAEKYLYSTKVITPGVVKIKVDTAATAGDKIIIAGTEYTWIANGETPTKNQIELPSTNNQANEAQAIADKLNERGDVSATVSSATVTVTQADDAVRTIVYAKISGTPTTFAVTITQTAETENPKGVQVFNLREAYNYEMAPEFEISSKEEFMANKECLRYMSRKIKEYARYMRDQSALFNTEGAVKFVPKDRMVLEVLAYAEEAFNSVLQSDTFHNEITALPGYRSVSSWQGLGSAKGTGMDAVDFESTSSINVTVSDGTQNGAEVYLSGIVAFMADKYAILHTIRSDRVAARNFDPEALDLYFYQFRDQYMNNLTQNALVFVVD